MRVVFDDHPRIIGALVVTIYFDDIISEEHVFCEPTTEASELAAWKFVAQLSRERAHFHGVEDV